MKSVIYIAGIYSQKMMQTAVQDSRGGMMFAAHNFDSAVLDGFAQQDNIDFHCISVPGCGSYPHNNKRFLTKPETYEMFGVTVHSIGFLNLVILNKLCLMLNLAKAILYFAKKSHNENVDVVISTATIYLQVAFRIASLLSSKKLRLTTIINDVPIIMDEMSNSHTLKMRIRTLLDRYCMRLLNKSDNLVLMTEQTMDFFRKDINHIVMEGIYKIPENVAPIEDCSGGKEIILYTGTISRQFGILNLVKAFEQVENPNSELWICGSGDTKHILEEKSATNARIKYYGLVDVERARSLQHEATILVNPRTSEGAYTKYSFPSKTMEYLASGKSVIINAIPCVPIEYFNYAFAPKDETVEELSRTIQMVMSMDKKERLERQVNGRNFIFNEKNSKIQVSRIIKML